MTKRVRYGLIGGCGLLVLLGVGLMASGCANLTPPKALFTPVTNVVSEVVEPKTNSVTVTNYVTETITQTNAVKLADGSMAQQVIIQPVQHAEMVTKTTVEFQTNQMLKVSYVPSDGAKLVAATAGSITDIFAPGLGGLVGKAGGGLLALVGGFFGHRLLKKGDEIEAVKATAQDQLENLGTVLTQMIENYREVVKTTPQGALADQKLMLTLQKDPRFAGVADLVANLVKTNVDNQTARELAQEIQQDIDRLTAGQPLTLAAPAAALAPAKV